MSAEKLKCNSFVFLDVETTGIPFHEADGGRTKITEISLMSVSREMLTKVHHDLPRKLPKLTINFNPHKMISDEVSRITGLSNLMLASENPFDERKTTLIRSFLEDCKPPICLIAHNGYYFDFPLLKEELIRFPNIIPRDTRCADTLLAFRNLYNQADVDEKTLTFNPFINKTDLLLINVADAVEKEFAAKPKIGVEIEDVDMAIVQMLNETTPQPQKVSSVPSPLPFDINSRKRKLFEDECDGDRSPIKNRSFSLSSVYYRIFGQSPENCHRAEDDTQIMIKCALKFGPQILDWFDAKSLLYEDIKPFYTRN